MEHGLDLLRDPRPLLTPLEAAAMLGVSTKTLGRWRRTGDGPAFVAPGPRLVRYRHADLEAFFSQRVMRNTTERRLRQR